MNVVRLFPNADPGAPEEDALPTRAAATRPAQAQRQRPAPPPRPASRALTPAEVLARSAVRSPPPGARLTPAAVIAQALDRPAGLDAFWAIWMAHHDVLRLRSLRLAGGNRADAEDALGAAMLRAAQAYARQPIRNPRAWLLRILHNACMDQHRRNACHAAIDDDLAAPVEAEGLGLVPRSPEEELEQAEDESAWIRAIRALPSRLSAPLRLHLEGWSDVDIARRLGVTREVVRKRRQLAKDWLREFLASP